VRWAKGADGDRSGHVVPGQAHSPRHGTHVAEVDRRLAPDCVDDQEAEENKEEQSCCWSRCARVQPGAAVHREQ
jgi:hypothetical protein